MSRRARALPLLLLTLSLSAACAKELRVLIGEWPPMAFKSADLEDRWSGFEVDLLRGMSEVTDGNLTFELVDVDEHYRPGELSTREVLNLTNAGFADMAVSGWTITRDRLDDVDFSQAYFGAGMHVGVPIEDLDVDSSAIATVLLSRFFGVFMMVLVTSIIIMANAMYFLERDAEGTRSGSERSMFRRKYYQGVWDTMWWAIVSLSTVGYGDTYPRRTAGRVLAILWMLFSLVVTSVILSVVVAAMTQSTATSSIKSAGDLATLRVGVVATTTADTFVRAIAGAVVVTYASEPDMFVGLYAGECSCVVTDSPSLIHYANTEGKRKMAIVGPLLDAQNYGIVLAKGSPLRPEIDRALVEYLRSGSFRESFARWFPDGVAATPDTIEFAVNDSTVTSTAIVFTFIVVSFSVTWTATCIRSRRKKAALGERAPDLSSSSSAAAAADDDEAEAPTLHVVNQKVDRLAAAVAALAAHVGAERRVLDALGPDLASVSGRPAPTSILSSKSHTDHHRDALHTHSHSAGSVSDDPGGWSDPYDPPYRPGSHSGSGSHDGDDSEPWHGVARSAADAARRRHGHGHGDGAGSDHERRNARVSFIPHSPDVDYTYPKGPVIPSWSDNEEYASTS